MSETRRDSILKSTAGQRMLGTVSPIYDDSYVALWIFEAMGREYDGLWAIIDELPAQFNPATATWAIGLWERRYGLTTPSAETLELRRINVQLKRSNHPPMSPASLASILEAITGNPAHVTDNVGTFTFGVGITTQSKEVIRQVIETVDRVKPSHLSYDITNTQYHDSKYHVGAYSMRRKSLVFREVQ